MPENSTKHLDVHSRRRKVVHVLTRLERAGAEGNTLATCAYQLRSGHDVTVIHGNLFDDSLEAELPRGLTRVQVSQMVHPIKLLHDVRAVLALRRTYRDIAPDLIHTHQSKAGVLGRLAAIGLPSVLVHTVHIAPFLNVGLVQRWIYLVLEKFCARFSDAIISVSDGMRDACLQYRVGDESKHHVIQSGMNINKFQDAKAPDSWTEAITDWPTAERPFIVLMLAAFEPRKRQEAFLQAIQPIVHRNANLCVLLCGQGVKLEACRQLNSELGMDTQVRLLGHVANPETLVALADLCVLTSQREGLPRVLIQYVGGGKAVLANHLPGIEEIIKSGHNGLVVAADDIDEIALHIERLAADRPTVARLSAASAATDVSAWHSDTMGSRIEKLYQRLWNKQHVANS